MAVFLHGAGAWRPGLVNNEAVEWQVAQNAEEFGFLGVVPEGSSSGSPDTLHWNVDVPNGVNEVAFIHAMVADISARVPLSPQAPRIALGFSNGAGLATLLGCHDSYNLWVAHVGVHIDPQSDYPSTCTAGTSSVPVWNAIGTQDFFITSLTPSPAEGITNQFRALHDASTCPREQLQVEQEGIVSCYSYNQCQSLGELCVYNEADHTILPSMTPNAWAFLTGVRGYALRGESTLPTEGGKPQSSTESNDQPSDPYYGNKPSGDYSNYGNKPTDNYSDYGNKPTDNYYNYGNKPTDNYSNYGNKPTDNYSNYGNKPSDNYSN
jgi:poly(3-hydroxybutyrate) depolymerase